MNGFIMNEISKRTNEENYNKQDKRRTKARKKETKRDSCTNLRFGRCFARGQVHYHHVAVLLAQAQASTVVGQRQTSHRWKSQ